MQSLIPILVIVLLFSPKLVREIKDYLLRKEQIKANTELRAEALRLKNSLELEKFIENSNNEAAYNQNINSDLNDNSFDTIKRERDSKYQ
ncbi:MAG: hypothetical protein ACYDG2_20415 [Ruminiclostridium sp.]